jgi:hypothetical protein
MGTRASFFIGDPQDIENREWLGCIAFDGFPEDDCAVLSQATSPERFAELVSTLAARDDFCDPAKHGFPFPWTDDLFLTDYTYAYFDGEARLTSGDQGWITFSDYADEAKQEVYYAAPESLPGDTPAPTQWDRSAPDSIMIISTSPVTTTAT